MTAETVTRPNGKIYKPRRGVEIDTFISGYGEMTGIIVMRTHDVARATELAEKLGYFTEYEIAPANHRLVWWRLVPWSSSYAYDSTYIADAERGTPCVVWEPVP